MVKNNTAVKDFIDDIPEDKLQNFVSSEKTIVEDRKHGFRLDHQGVNNDGSEKDRLYIQPLGGKSKASQLPKGSVVAQIHVTDPGDIRDIKDTLFKSYKNGGKLMKLK